MEAVVGTAFADSRCREGENKECGKKNKRPAVEGRFAQFMPQLPPQHPPGGQELSDLLLPIEKLGAESSLTCSPDPQAGQTTSPMTSRTL